MTEATLACVVVGAGLAGLSAATELTRRGLDVVVLEARERVGGRIVNLTSATGERVELGGQWISPGHDRMLELVERQGLELAPAASGTSAALLEGTTVPLETASDEAGLSPFEVADLGQGLLRFRRLSERVLQHPDWASANAAWLTQPLGRWTRSNLRTAGGQATFTAILHRAVPGLDDDSATLDAALRQVAGRDLDSLAVVNSGQSLRRVSGGLAQVGEGLAAALGDRVRLGEEVSSILHTDDGVVVTTSRGHTFQAPEVVIAVPPRVVEAIDIQPPLPAWRSETVAEMPRGNVIKAALVYETPWWRERGMSGQVGSDSGPMRVMSDASDPASTRGILNGYFEGPEASHLGDWSVSLRERAFTDAVERVFGTDVPAPLEYLEIDWSSEDFTGGCHGAHFAPSIWTAVSSSLAESDGRIHFAGAEYASRFTGYAEGAVRSGLDAAAAVARPASVRRR